MTIGLKDLYYSLITEADGKETYGAPVALAAAISADLSVATATGQLFADDAVSEDVAEFVSATLKLGVKDIGNDAAAVLLGQKLDKDGVLWANKDDVAPYVAIGFRAKKSGNNYKYIWMRKGKFAVPSEKYNTKADKITFNTSEIDGTFIADSDGNWKSDYTGLETTTKAKAWFTAVPKFATTATA